MSITKSGQEPEVDAILQLRHYFPNTGNQPWFCPSFMVQTKPKFYSFADYLAYDDGTDCLYELFNGRLIEVPPESSYNTSIAFFLSLQFVAQVGHLRVRPYGLKLEVRGEPKNRYPDLTILQPEHVQRLAAAIPFDWRCRRRCWW